MAINLTTEQINDVKKQLDKDNRHSRFVIVLAVAKESGTGVHIVTNYDNYRNMVETNAEKFDFKVIRDIMPITDNLVKWAVSQQNAHQYASEPNDQDKENEAVADLEHYTHLVIIENKVGDADPKA